MGKVFVTGGTGYVGSVLIDEAQKSGYDIVVLTRSAEKAKHLNINGIEAVVGDLLVDGPWQNALAECEYIIHLASPPTWGKKVSKKVAEAFSDGHYQMTVRLLDLVDRNKIKNIVYVAGTSYYGDTGEDMMRDESYISDPKGWGPYIAPSVNVLDRYRKQGLPITTVFPAQIYGAASWTEQLFMKPLYNNKPVYSLKGYSPYFSPIHVEDTARACLYLAAHGVPGERYILCDPNPMRSAEFMGLIEQELRVQGKTIEIPRWLCKLIIGPVLTEYATAHTLFTNRKVLDTGFQFRYGSAKEGIPHVVKQWLAMQQ